MKIKGHMQETKIKWPPCIYLYSKWQDLTNYGEWFFSWFNISVRVETLMMMMIFICISLYFHQNFIYNSWFLASSRLCVCVCVCVCVCSNYVASIIEQFPLEWEISPHKIMLSIDTNYNEIDIYFDFPWSYILYYSNQLVFFYQQT
jgi:hypothetical protein